MSFILSFVQIVLFSTIQSYCIVICTILQLTACTLFIHTSQHYKRFDLGLEKKAPHYRVNTEHSMQTPVLQVKSRIEELLTSLSCDWEIFPPFRPCLLISSSNSWHMWLTTALKFLLNLSLVAIVMVRACSCLSPFARLTNPEAESVEMEIGPGWQMLLVKGMTPAIRLSAFSDGTSIVELNVEKLSVINSIYCLFLRMMSAWNCLCGWLD